MVAKIYISFLLNKELSFLISFIRVYFMTNDVSTARMYESMTEPHIGSCRWLFERAIVTKIHLVKTRRIFVTSRPDTNYYVQFIWYRPDEF